MKLFFKYIALFCLVACSPDGDTEKNYLLSELNFSPILIEKLNSASDTIVIISENHCQKCINETLTLINDGTTVITNYHSDLKAKRTLGNYSFYNVKSEIFNENASIDFNYPLLLVRDSGKYWFTKVIDDNFIFSHD